MRSYLGQLEKRLKHPSDARATCSQVVPTATFEWKTCGAERDRTAYLLNAIHGETVGSSVVSEYLCSQSRLTYELSFENLGNTFECR